MISVKKLLYKAIEELSIKTVTTDTISSLPYTYTNSAIKAHHVVVHGSLGNPMAQASIWRVTTSNGSLTIEGTIAEGETTKVMLKLAKGI